MNRQPPVPGGRFASSALCMLIVLLLAGPAMATEPAQMSTRGDPIVTAEIDWQCQDRGRRSGVIEDFAQSLEATGAVVFDADPLTHDTFRSTIRQLRSDEAGAESLCHAVLASGALEVVRSESRFLQANGSGRAGFGSRCFGPEQYYSIQVIKSVLDIVKAIAAGWCSGSGCDNATASCTYACLTPFFASIASLALDLQLQIDDKCANAEHYRQIAEIRGPIVERLQSLGVDVQSASTIAGGIDATAGTDIDVEAIIERMRNGWGTPFGRDTDSILARIESLQQTVAEAAVSQNEGETAAIAIVVERALIDGRPLASLRLPGSAGGLIELVREVVSRRIVAFQAAGVDVRPTLNLFRKGDDALNDGLYSRAFDHYQAAYAALGDAGRSNAATIAGEKP